MADTIRERIVKNIVTSLQGITVANGYDNTVLSVQRLKQSGNPAIDVPLILVAEGPENASAGPNPLTNKVLEVSIGIVTRQDEAVDPRSADEMMNSLRGDVEKAMVSNYTRGGLAIDTMATGGTRIGVQEGEPELGIEMLFEIHYRHARTDPRSLT